MTNSRNPAEKIRDLFPDERAEQDEARAARITAMAPESEEGRAFPSRLVLALNGVTKSQIINFKFKTPVPYTSTHSPAPRSHQQHTSGEGSYPSYTSSDFSYLYTAHTRSPDPPQTLRSRRVQR